MFTRYLIAITLLITSIVVRAGSLDYQLEIKEIAPDTYLLEGANENFNKTNGGHIANIVFVVTEEGVVLFDTGPSFRFGVSLRQQIKKITDKPIVRVFNSHHHPDHFLGNQAFSDSTIVSLPETGQLIASEGDAFASNMYTLVGDWMRGTKVYLPDEPLETDSLTLGSHQFEFHRFTGHSGGDLVVIDKTTGVMIASDLVFYQRASTTPHTPGLDIWIDDLESLKSLEFKTLVPGHGPVSDGYVAIDQTIAYLRWLDTTLREAADKGLSMNETMSSRVVEEFASLAEVKEELSRSVVHLYQDYEISSFK